MSIWRYHKMQQLLPKVRIAADDECRKYIFIYQCDLLGFHTIKPEEMTLEELEKIWEVYEKECNSSDPKKWWNNREIELREKIAECSNLIERIRRHYGGWSRVPDDIKRAYYFNPLYDEDRKAGMFRSKMTDLDNHLIRLRLFVEHL